MKGKIGIVTLYGCYNFGNRLQNYAVQKTFEKRGFEVETIIAERSQIRYWARHCKRIISGYCGNQTGKRYNTFYKFNKKVVPHSYFFGNNGQFTSDLADKYDFFVVGSDQVWNPELRKNERDNFFLSFAKRNQRICLSPSIAVDRIEDHYVSQFSAALNRFPYLSCRESTGAEEIRRITKKDCFHIIDPTLSLTCEEWQEFSSTVKVSENYIIIFFLGDISDERREVIREYCSKRKYEIIEPSNPNNKYYSISPNELVYLVDNAKMVFTDSFHLTAFSINMNTPFYVFDRHDKLDSSNKMNSRIKSLTKQFNLENRYVSGEEDFEITENCDFGETNAVLQQERDKYNHFLDICLEQKSYPFNNLPDKDCTGCGVCAQKCPRKCINMVADFDGFVSPEISENNCIKCNQCVKVCPVINRVKYKNNKKDFHAYLAYQKDKEALSNSSSGAVFPLLAENVISKGGVVFGAVFSENFDIVHTEANTLEACKAMYSSKYVQSVLGDSFLKVKDALLSGRQVLFCGTPCQNEALRSFLGTVNLEKLLQVDFVCHGVPSSKVWHSYLDYIATKWLNGEQIEYVNFRDKTEGWERYSIKIRSKGNTYRKNRLEDWYCKAFSTNISLRESCYGCKFKGVKRMTDITLSDFWGIDKYYPNMKNDTGTSLVLIQSDKGMQIWQELTGVLYQKEIDISNYIGNSNTAMVRPVSVNSDNRSKFFALLGQEDFPKLVERYATEEKRTLGQRVRGKIKRTFRIK